MATRGVLAFWRDELGLKKNDVPRVCRAFPSLLGVDVQKQRKVVAFLREIGVVNVARFATRLPPVLAYDVDADLRPKMAHLAASALSVYDVVRFPAYFSYPLDTVIRPRTAFLESYGLPLTRFELKTLHRWRRPVREARRRRLSTGIRRLQGRVPEGAREPDAQAARRPPRGLRQARDHVGDGQGLPDALARRARRRRRRRQAQAAAAAR